MGKRRSVSMSDASLPPGGEAGQAGQQVYDHLELLAAMGKDFASSGDIEASLKCAVEHITEYLYAEGGALFLLAWIAVLHYVTVNLPALAILLLIIFADIAARHMHLVDSRAARAATPIVLAAVCCVPALDAVALAYFLAAL